jgi:hypothetical protein
LLTIDDIGIEEIKEEEEGALAPIACKFCEPPAKFATYIDLDFVLHLSQTHNIRRGYLDTLLSLHQAIAR